MKLSATTHDLVLRFQYADRDYSPVNGGEGPVDDDKVPYEEVIIHRGNSFELPDGAVFVGLGQLGLGMAANLSSPEGPADDGAY